jgi:hypothetical protein
LSIYQFLVNRGALGLVAFLVLCLTVGSARTLAAQTVTATSWLRPIAITGPRILRIGARVDWQ